MARGQGFKECPSCGKEAGSNAQPKCKHCGHVWYVYKRKAAASESPRHQEGRTVAGKTKIGVSGETTPGRPQLYPAVTVTDPEILCLNRLVADLSKIGSPACDRVLAYLCDRFTCSCDPDFKLDKAT